MLDLRGRETQIDGLRGLCALLVAAHHLAYFHAWWTTGRWALPLSAAPVFMLGKTAVAVFFLICAYLFWGRVSAAERGDRPLDARRLLWGRVTRLCPLYVAAMTLCVLAGLAATGFVPSQPLLATLAQALAAYSFAFVPAGDFNGVFLAGAGIAVAWSLRYEWLFYLSLPALRALRLARRWFLWLPLAIAVNEAVLRLPFAEYFAYGGLAYELSRLPALRDRLARPIPGVLSATLFVVVIGALSWQHILIGIGPLLLFLAFVPVACGADVLGLLRRPGLLAIGSVSYSLYLLNIPLFWALTTLWHPQPGPIGAALADAATLLAAICASLATYRAIERPGMALAPPRLRPRALPLPPPVTGGGFSA